MHVFTCAHLDGFVSVSCDHELSSAYHAHVSPAEDCSINDKDISGEQVFIIIKGKIIQQQASPVTRPEAAAVSVFSLL